MIEPAATSRAPHQNGNVKDNPSNTALAAVDSTGVA